MRFRIFFVFALTFSFLDLQAQSENIKVMQYNLMYYKTSSAPCNHSVSSSTRDQHLTDIVAYVAPDILLVNELGTSPVNPLVMMRDVLNVQGVSHFERAGNSNNSTSSLVNMLFYNKDKLTLKSQSRVDRDLNNTPIIRVIDFYRLYVNDSGLGTPGVDTVFINIGLAHLKAGNSSADQTQRDRATAAVMAYIDQELAGENVLFAGDFNVYRSSEAAFQNLINYSSNPSVSLNDPINQLGSWNNNSNFATVHTQSTHSSSQGCFSGGGMDDRFDFILASDAVMNNTLNLEYVGYRAVGQDGGSYNSGLSTNNNTDVPSNIASALYNFSDHLPVVMDLRASVSGLGFSEWKLADQHWNISNPARERFTVFFNQASPAQSLRIINLQGQIIQPAIPIEGLSMEVTSNSWARGLYLVQLLDEQGRVYSEKKLLKE